MGRSFIVLAVLLMLLGSPLRAQMSSTEHLGSSNKKLGDLSVHGVLSTESFQYPTPIEENPNLNQNNMLEAGLTLDQRFRRGEAHLSGQAGKSINLNYQYVAVQEAYGGSSDGQIVLGRKIYHWSQADEDWNLGLWQPLFQQDGLRPLSEGLTGLFYNVENSHYQVLAFATPIFIPTMSPDIAEKNGTLVSESRWFNPLPAQAPVLGHPTQLVYRLNIPDMKSLILKPGMGLRVRAGDPEMGPSAAFGVAHKPINSLFIKYDAAVLARNSAATGQIEVSPVVHMHQLYSLDFSFATEAGNLGVSFLQDVPETRLPENQINGDGFRTDNYQQDPQPVQLIALRGQSHVQLPWVDRRMDWTLLYLHAHSDSTIDVDSQGNERSRFIPNRLMFTNAVSGEGEVTWNSKWKSRVKYLRDFDQSGTLISGEIEYRPHREWALSMGFDVLGVDDEQAQANDTRFLNVFRQNDRVYGGLSYVF